MNERFKRLGRMLILVSLLACVSQTSVLGHGNPIDVIVTNNTLSPFMLDGKTTFDVGEFEESRLVGSVSADAPGLGVTNAANGVEVGTFLGIDIVSSLAYWNGELSSSDAALKIVSPSGAENYLVTSKSGPQSGILWGKYSGERAWESEGTFSLSASGTPSPGIYGTMVELTSPSYKTSEPFLLPLVFDPASVLTETQRKQGIDAMEQSLLASLSTDVSGDFNSDGSLDTTDVDLLCDGIAAGDSVFDANSDGEVDLADLEHWLVQVDSLNADIDLDGEVSFSDFLEFSQSFGEEGASTKWSHGDFDCDSKIGFPDFLIMSRNFGQVASAGLAASTIEGVPEPKTMGLVAITLVCLSLRLAKKQN